MKKRVFSLILALCMIFTLLPMSAFASTAWDGRTSEPFAGGSGTEEDPYLISNAAQLYYLSLQTTKDDSTTDGKYYKLTNCIDLNGIRFNPIDYFHGTLDGAGHTILGLNVSGTNNEYVALIRNTNNAVIKDIMVSGCVSGGRCAAGIVASSKNTIILNCTNDCSISSNGSAAGIVGVYRVNSECTFLDKCEIKNCKNLGKVAGNSAAGICGSCTSDYTDVNLFISCCSNVGTVEAKEAAGIVRVMSMLAKKEKIGKLIISNCYNAGDIEGETAYGLVSIVIGECGEGSINNCYNTGVAKTSDSAPCCTTHVYCLEGVNPNATNPSGTIANSEEDMQVAAGFNGFDFLNVWTWDNTGNYKYPILKSLGLVNVPCDEHSWKNNGFSIESTCVYHGEKHSVCTACGKIKYEELPYSEHRWDSGNVTQEATCTEDGIKTFTCIVCGSSKDEAVKAKDHKWGEWSVCEPATCEKNGKEIRSCSLCNISEYREIQAGHNYSTVVTEPTCTEKGYTTYTCQLCKDTYIADYTNELGHSIISYEAKKPTCSTVGWDAYEECERCNYSTYNEIPATGHDITHHSEKKPTCDSKGWNAYDTCSRCDYTTYSEVPALGHRYEPTVTKPTCTEKGFTSYICGVCGDSYKDNYTKALGHNYADGVCTRCGEDDPNYNPPHVHSYKNGICECGEKLTSVFKDVAAGGYYFDAVQWAVENDITKGTSTTTFSPNKICTRGQIVTFLWRAFGSEKVTGVKNPFEDVKPGDYYYDAVMWAIKNNITSGMDKTHFMPNASVTRGQTVTFMWRAAGNKTVQSENMFVDVTEGTYYYDAVQWAVKNGITNGMTATTFSPNSGCTRGQIVTFLYRYFG